MDNKALGKGLSALISERAQVNKGDSVAYVKTALISNSKHQPRVNYDDEKLADLKASIQEKGVLQPILIREQGDQFEVVAGERRLRAAKALNMEEIPAIVKTVSDQEALVIALVENIQREELNPVEEAESYKKLIEEFKYTQDSVAQSVGKNRSTISNILRLLKLPNNIQAGLRAGHISMGHARALLGTEVLALQTKIFEDIIKNGLSVRNAEQMVKDGNKGKSKSQSKQQEKGHEIIALEEKLRKSFGTKVSITSKKNRGKIVIEYYSLDDLDRIIGLVQS